MIRINILSIIVLALFLSCKSSDSNQTSQAKNLAVCTTGMIGDMVTNIVGDSMDVLTLMGPGVDPHLYKATQNDLQHLKKADIVFYNGLHLEGKMAEIFKKYGKIKKVVAIGDFADSTKFLIDETYPDVKDPHIWFDVALWASCLDGVTESICDSDPGNCDYYQKNAAHYEAMLNNLDEEVKNKISSINKQQRILITAHDAFRYFGKAYDIEVRGLQGISTLSEFGLKDRVELVNYIIENKIPTVFVESSVSPKNIEAIIEGCLQKGHIVKKGESLYSDAMGPEGTDEGSYQGMVRSNVRHIVSGLKIDNSES